MYVTMYVCKLCMYVMYHVSMYVMYQCMHTRMYITMYVCTCMYLTCLTFDLVVLV